MVIGMECHLYIGGSFECVRAIPKIHSEYLTKLRSTDSHKVILYLKSLAPYELSHSTSSIRNICFSIARLKTGSFSSAASNTPSAAAD